MTNNIIFTQTIAFTRLIIKMRFFQSGISPHPRNLRLNWRWNLASLRRRVLKRVTSSKMAPSESVASLATPASSPTIEVDC